MRATNVMVAILLFCTADFTIVNGREIERYSDKESSISNDVKNGIPGPLQPRHRREQQYILYSNSIRTPTTSVKFPTPSVKNPTPSSVKIPAPSSSAKAPIPPIYKPSSITNPPAKVRPPIHIKKKMKSSKSDKSKKSKKLPKDGKGSKGKGKGGKGGKGKGGQGDDTYYYDDAYYEDDATGKGKGGSYDDDYAGKGKGKGGGGRQSDSPVPTPMMMAPAPNGGGFPGCQSEIASSIEANVKHVIAINPIWCCNYVGPTAVYVTNALSDPMTPTGLEPFWDAMYMQIAAASEPQDICFVMTGIKTQDGVDRTDISTVLINANLYASSILDVVSIMSTDPTSTVELINTIRSISDTPEFPSIGIFNSGYNNIIIESVVSGKGRIPYVGYLNDEDFGKQAASISLNLLNGLEAVPLCFNARVDSLDTIGKRCAAYYDDITSAVIEPIAGVPCSATSSVQDIYNQIIAGGVNAVFTQLECCSVVADAVSLVKSNGTQPYTIVVGCMDDDTSGGKIDFVTTQPLTLQAFQTASFANFPVIQGMMGKNGRLPQYFPSTQSLVNTEIFNVLID